MDDDERSTFSTKTMPTPRMAPRNKQVSILFFKFSQVDDDIRSTFSTNTMPTPRMAPCNKQVGILHIFSDG
jgi:hypothetical protein